MPMRNIRGLKAVVCGIIFLGCGLAFGGDVVLLDAGGVNSQWSKTVKLDLGDSATIAVRVSSSKKADCVLSLKSGKGGFERDFNITPCEQVILVPKGSFTRQKGTAGWMRIENVKLSIKTSGVSADLLSIKGFAKGKDVPGKGLYVLQPVSPVTPVGKAWPVRAIIDESVYPKRVENAGTTLQKYLKQLYNVTLPVNPKGQEQSMCNVILVGKDAALKSGIVSAADLKKQGFNGFVVKIKNGSLAIAGDSVQGTNYGVYKFLEKQGLKFFARGCFTERHLNKHAIIAMNFEDKPFFDGKRLTAPFCIYGDSSSGFSLGDVRFAGIDKDYPCDKTLWIDHTAAFLVPKKLYLKDHPEYYILRGNGKRLPADTPDVRLMVCQTNPGGLKVAAERALKWIEKQKDRKYFVIQQGDDMEACLCQTCEKKRKDGWNESDLMLNWVNHIAGEVKKNYPDKTVLCYAYVSTQPAPAKLALEKNVQVLYAPWPSKISAPNGFRDFDAPENVIAGSQLQDWIKQCGPENLGIYDYNSYSALTLRGMADRVKWLARNGMKGGFWYCGTPQIFPNLFRYVHAQLNWDPFQNVRTLEKEFIRAYYGQAAPLMERIIETIYDRLDEDDRNNGRKPDPTFFGKAFTKQVLAWFDEAAKLAPVKIQKEIESDRHNFIINGVYALKPINRQNVTKDQFDVFCMVLSDYIKYELKQYKALCERACNE